MQAANEGFDLQKEDNITRLSHIVHTSACIIQLYDFVDKLSLWGKVHLVNEVKGLSPSTEHGGIVLLLHGWSVCLKHKNALS